jgi:hypothetical protein
MRKRTFTSKKIIQEGGNIHTALLNVLRHFIIQACNDISVGTVIRSLKKVAYHMVSTEDKLLWQDDGEAEVKATPSDSESDLCDDLLENTCMSQNVLNELPLPC